VPNNKNKTGRQRNQTAKPQKPFRKGKSGGKRGMCLQDRPVLEPDAAGIDIGAREIYVAVPPDRDPRPVRVFQTFTDDLIAIAQWLEQCGATTAAMESTGVYWIPLYEILQEHGLRTCLTNPRGMKNVPGRRTDWHECQWLQYLHSMGLLAGSFRPDSKVVAVRTLMRHRQGLVRMAAQHVQHMHKALTQMNLQIHHVISDITGVTGTAIVDAILAGERDPAVLAKLRDPNIKASAETIRRSLIGDWSAEHLFTLRQSRKLYDDYKASIGEVDGEIERLLGEMEGKVDPQEKPLPPDRKRNGKTRRCHHRQKNDGFDLRQQAYRLFGVDVTQIPGLQTSALTLFSETGRDMRRWRNAAAFAAWAGLCPDNDITGGKVQWRGARKVKSRVGDIFRIAASSLHNNHSPLGDYLRKMKARLGKQGGVTATAHKIAVIYYTLIHRQVEYDESIWAERDALRPQRLERKLKRQAERLGYELVLKQNSASPKPAE
jgi:transposase